VKKICNINSQDWVSIQGRKSAYWVQKTGSQTSEENLLVGFERNWVSNPRRKSAIWIQKNWV
jgi:hypothetical protein